MSPTDRPEKPFFLPEAATLTTLLVALLYTAGWSFAYHYYNQFHLGLIELDIPKEYLFVYSLWVIKDQVFLSFAALVITVLLYFLVRFCFQQARADGKNRRYQGLSLVFGFLLTPVVILFMFWEFCYLGDLSATALYEKQKRKDFDAYPRVTVWLKEKAHDAMRPVAEEWEKGCYRLLLRNKDRLYLFNTSDDEFPVEVIPLGDVKAVRVLPFYQSCKE